MREPKEFVGEVEGGELKDEEEAELEAETKEFGDDGKEQKPGTNDADYKP